MNKFSTLASSAPQNPLSNTSHSKQPDRVSNVQLQLAKPGIARIVTQQVRLDFAAVKESVTLSHSDASGAVMSLRKRRFSAMLATVLIFAAAERLDRYLKESNVPEMNASANDPSLAGSFRATNQMPPPDLLLVQSKNAENLGTGKVLVASRNLGDPHFAKTVILLVRYDAQGVLGLILNRRTDVPISRVLEGVKAAKDRSDPVYLGGPLETPAVFALFQSPSRMEGAEPIFDGVYLITSRSLFEQTISSRPNPGVFHVYLGYAGWTQDQLQKEVELGAWFIFPADAGAVFNPNPDSLWQQMIRNTELQLALGETSSWLVSVDERHEIMPRASSPLFRGRSPSRRLGSQGRS